MIAQLILCVTYDRGVLRMSDKMTTQSAELSDIHALMAQCYIKKQFPLIGGLHGTLMQEKTVIASWNYPSVITGMEYSTVNTSWNHASVITVWNTPQSLLAPHLSHHWYEIFHSHRSLEPHLSRH